MHIYQALLFIRKWFIIDWNKIEQKKGKKERKQMLSEADKLRAKELKRQFEEVHDRLFQKEDKRDAQAFFIATSYFMLPLKEKYKDHEKYKLWHILCRSGLVDEATIIGFDLPGNEIEKYIHEVVKKYS